MNKKVSSLEAYTDIVNGYNDFVSKIVSLCGPDVIRELDKDFVVMLMKAKSQIYDKIGDMDDELERTEYLVNNILALVASLKYVLEDAFDITF